MKINSIQRDMSLKQGSLALHSEPQNFREKNSAGVYKNNDNRGYNAAYSGSFTGKSEAAASALKKGGILTKNWFGNFLSYCYNHNISTSALIALGLAGVLRPATIMALPGKKDKEDKIYASGHSMASGIIGFIASTIITSPFDESIKKVFGNPEKYKSKKLAKMLRIEKDLAKAVEWYKKAAEQNDYRAMCCMGSYFLMGQAVPCMPERAFQLFEKAANANIPAAQYNLSILYRYGEGVEKDIDLADTWRMKAAQNGFKLAIEEIHKEVGIE